MGVANMMRSMVYLASSLLAFDAVQSIPTFTPFLPPSYPLAVRNPYLSVWLPGNQASELPSASPQFWYGNNLSWAILGRVDDQVYNLFGVPSPTDGSLSATVLEGKFTATHSVFVVAAGAVNITLDFFSPVSFHDYVRQSLPFSYLTVSAVPLDGESHSIQLYSDIDETWTGQSGQTVVQFSTFESKSIFQLKAEGQIIYTQSPNEQALWGEAVFASNPSENSTLSTKSGPGTVARGQFQSNGSLDNIQQSWATGNVVAIAHDLGSIASQSSITFGIGYVREAAINYFGEAQTGYYRAIYPDTISVVSHFLDDYSAATTESSKLDAEIQTTGSLIAGQKYADILSLSVIQTFGGIDVTIPNDTLSTDNAAAFIKEISSDGNINTIDIIIELLPFFYIFNPDYIPLLLDPVLRYLATGRYTQPFVIHDIGTHYPNATGHDDLTEEQMPVEESGNLLLLVAAYQASSGDKAWAASWSSLLDSYANYLIDNGLYPVHQLSTNDGLGAFTNMTQLGVKAAVALSAYGQLTGNQTYSKYGDAYASTIYTNGTGVEVSSTTQKTYFTLTYGSSTWFMLYNLYPARLFNLTVFPSDAYSGQSALYPTVRGDYGVPIEGGVQWGKTDWQMWSAAIAEEAVREQMINDLYSYVSNGLNDAPFPDRYWANGSNAGVSAENFRARPVLGAHFAIWALDSIS